MVDSLGYVTVTTPGTLVRATVNEPDPTRRIGVQAILFQALPTNAGVVYYGLAGMNRTTGVNVLGILPAPSDPTTGPFPSASPSLPLSAAGLNAADFYVDADSGSDGVLVVYTQG